MKLRKIKIVNFGKFSNQEFDLATDQLAVFFGENEAGKSTLVAFIKQILFGFYLKNNGSSFFEDYAPLANVSPMGGSLFFENEAGQTYELERLWAKGNKTKRGILTVRLDGQEVPEATFYDQISNIDGNFYADSFIYNLTTLSQISNLKQKDLLERIYFLGMSQSNQLLALRDGFSKEAQNLFKPTGKKPIVNQDLNAVAEAEEELETTKSEYLAYQTNEQALMAKNKEVESQETQIAKLRYKLNDLHKLQEQSENYKRLQALQAQIKPLKFDQGQYQEAQRLSQQQQNLVLMSKNLQQQQGAVKKVDEDWLKQAQECENQQSESFYWQTQLQLAEQKSMRLTQEIQQMEALNDDLAQISQLNSDQIKQMQAEKRAYQEVRDQAAKNKVNYSWMVIPLMLIGWLIFQFKLLGLAISIPILAFVWWMQKYFSQQAGKQQEHKLASLREQFNHKYQLEIEKVEVDQVASQLAQYQAKKAELVANEQELAADHEKIAAYLQKLQMLLGYQVTDLHSGYSDLKAKLTDAKDQTEKLRQTQQNLDLNQTELSKIEMQLQVLLTKAQVSNMTDYDNLYQAALEQTSLQTQIDALKSSLGENLERLSQMPDFTLLNDKAQECQAELSKLISELSSTKAEVAELRVRQENIANSEKVFMAKQNLANRENQLIKSSQEYLANLLAASIVDRALELASNERFPKMVAYAKKYFKLLTGGRYTDIILDDKLQVVRLDGKKLKVPFLSRGTAEQLYFALKLAFVEQVSDQINLPILIDDSFVNFDEQRIGYIEQLVNKISEHNQVLIFTAQKSLVSQLKQKPVILMKGSENA